MTNVKIYSITNVNIYNTHLPVLAGISVPFSVFTSQKVTHEQQTININGM
jgi:hypothetical protein